MDPRARFIAAAARALAQAWSAPGPLAPPPPGVAEAAMVLPGPPGQAPEVPGLEELAGQLVALVLELAQEPQEPEALRLALEQAVERHLEERGRMAPGLKSRLAAQVPGLLNLPALARLAGHGLELAPALAAAPDDETLVGGASPAFAQVLKDLEMVAAIDLPVLLIGETGTGKEMLARRLHQLSPRRQGPLVAVNCAGLAKGLLESELFGHVKGAFTGAAAPGGGYIRAAQGGTLFLDEIGETTPEFQVRLLRVLEDRVVTPVGSTKGQRVDFRLVTASSRDLEEAAAQGQFNQALLYRILVVPVRLPALHERREDLPALVDHFLAQACLLAKRTRRLTPELRQWLLDYHWPGNVRQLRHLLQRLVALSPGFEIGLTALPPELTGPDPGLAQTFEARLRPLEAVPARWRPGLAQALAQAAGGELANRDLRGRLGCSDSTAKNLLKVLDQAGLVRTTGDRGGRRYLVALPGPVPEE